MGWIKLDTQFFFRPKVLRAGRDSRELYLAGLCYLAQFPGYDFIPGPMIPRLTDSTDYHKVAQNLIDVELWERLGGDYYRITDWLNCSIMPDKSTQDLRKCREYKAWRRAVQADDEYTCQACGVVPSETKNLHAHHILPWATFPNMRFDRDNGISLCKSCHEQIHREMREHA